VFGFFDEVVGFVFAAHFPFFVVGVEAAGAGANANDGGDNNWYYFHVFLPDFWFAGIFIYTGGVTNKSNYVSFLVYCSMDFGIGLGLWGIWWGKDGLG
jgi:hypothetical protein